MSTPYRHVGGEGIPVPI